MIRRVFSTTFYSVCSRAFFTTANLLVIYIVSRFLPETNLGNYSIVFIFMSLFSVSASLGINHYYSKQVAHVRDNKNELSDFLSDFYSITFRGILLSIFLVVVLLLFYDEISSTLLIISFLLGIFLGIELNLGGILLGLEKMKWEAFFQFGAFMILFLAYFSLRNSLSLELILLVRIIVFILGVIVRFVVLKSYWNQGKIVLKLKFWKEQKFFLFSNIVYIIYRQADIFLLSLSISKEELAPYFLSIRIYFALNLLAEVISFSMTPFISRIFQKKETKSFKRFVGEIFLLSILGGCGCGLLLYWLGGFVVELFNPDLREAAEWIVKFFALAVPFRFSAYFLGNLLTSSQYQHVRFYIMSGISVLYVVATFLMIQFFAIRGAVMTRVYSEVFVFTLYFLYVVFILLKKHGSIDEKNS